MGRFSDLINSVFGGESGAAINQALGMDYFANKELQNLDHEFQTNEAQKGRASAIQE